MKAILFLLGFVAVIAIITVLCSIPYLKKAGYTKKDAPGIAACGAGVLVRKILLWALLLPIMALITVFKVAKISK